MEIFWNKPDTDKINGLDVIGLRRIDQGVEKEWVAGITTISIRAKYISMLAWGLVEAYKIMPEKDGAKEFDEKILNDVFSRVEFLVLAASKWSAKKREAKDDGGLLGADTHKKEIAELLEKGEVVVPSGKVVGLIGTYYVTSSIFGFVFHDPNSALPISITPRGKQIWETIDDSLQDSGLKELVLKGGSLSTDLLNKEGHIFAANEILNNPKEKKQLEEAFLNPANESEELNLIYSNQIYLYLKHKSHK